MALTLVPVAAGAQTARNPFADLFGRAPSQDRPERTTVHVRTTAGVQFGKTLEADFDRQDIVPEGVAAGADATLAGEFVRNRVELVGQTRYSYQEFRKAPAFGAPAFDAAGRVRFDVTTRFSLHGGAQFIRSPFFRMLWLPPQVYGDSFPTASDGTAILMTRNDTAQGEGGFTAELGRRTTLTAAASTRQTRFDGLPEHDFTTVGARSMLRREISRGFGVHAGYSREELRMRPVTPLPGATIPETTIEPATADSSNEIFLNEIIDVGVDFAKSFSMGRRTTFFFGTETSFVRQNDSGRQFRLNGNAAFERRFLRTWITQLSARRATEFVPGFRGPLFTERGTAQLAGYFTKRLLLNAGFEGGRGELGVGDIGRGTLTPGEVRVFTTYSGNAALTFGLTRHFGVFGQYVYYNYQMPRDPRALVTVQHLSRQAVSFGVKTWISLIDKEQVPRDPR